jgi:hypothetical protein
MKAIDGPTAWPRAGTLGFAGSRDGIDTLEITVGEAFACYVSNRPR